MRIFFIFRKNRKNLKKALTFRNFWRGGASSKSTIISTCSSKTCERFGELGHSLFCDPPPMRRTVVVQRWLKICRRRLYHSARPMSSLFCDSHQLNAVWSSLAQSAKIAPIIQYSSDAVKYYLRVAANSGKLSLVLTNLGGCAIIYDNF